MLAQIRIGGRDDAHVHFDRLRVADALELARLQHAQELRLQRRAHRPDFVEEQRAAVRLLEPALPVGDGARERAAHVPEELGFEQRLGNGAAVDRDEPLTAPRAAVVNRARGQLLADAGLAGDRAPCSTSRPPSASRSNICSMIGVRPIDAVEPEAILKLRAQVGVFGLQPPLFHRRVKLVQQLFELKRLGDEPLGAEPRDLDRLAHRRQSR